MQWDLAELELQLMGILAGQGLLAAEVRLIGLLGKGSRATVFSVLVNGVHHVLKVYDSRESWQQELKNLRKVTPRDRLVLPWRGEAGGQALNLVIIEVPEGRQLTSERLSDAVGASLAARMAELHRLRYRQLVSVAAMRESLDHLRDPFLAHVEQMGREVGPYEALLETLRRRLTEEVAVFRVRKVRVHGDLWWPNVVAAQEGVYLVDWESVRRGDAAEDIAKFRFYLHYPRNYQPSSVFFWQAAEDGEKVGAMMKVLVERHGEVAGDTSLMERLKLYLPYLAVRELAHRYLGSHFEAPVDRALNEIIADEALVLAETPLANPPDLRAHGYFAAVEATREVTT
jgi:thiamine kinase-like enzyme